MTAKARAMTTVTLTSFEQPAADVDQLTYMHDALQKLDQSVISPLEAYIQIYAPFLLILSECCLELSAWLRIRQLVTAARAIATEPTPESASELVKMHELETDVEATLAEINEVETELKEARLPKDLKYLRAKELLLHERLTYLRDDLKRLHSKEAKRLDDLQPLRAQQLLLIEEAKKQPVGTLPFPGEREVGFEENVWLGMCNEVQQRILLLISSRRQFAQVKALCNMRASMTEAVATDLGIEVLHAVDGKVLLGVFNVPALDGIIETGPKGFRLEKTSLFYLPERAHRVEELLDAHKVDENFKQNYGALLSGPNGVGKSAVGLLSFACCFAQGLLAVYTPSTQSWLEAARNGRGDEFFLEHFFVQNADKIAATPKLRRVFAARLRGAPVHAKLMVELRAIVNTRPGPSVIVINDEAQHITNMVDLLKTASISAESQRAASYFSTCWLNWDHANICFLRMDIASSHGRRELDLPSGEHCRLRFVDPWPLVIARAALLHKRSPLFVARTYACERILHVAGGVVRRMFECKNELPTAGRFTLKHLAVMEACIRERMTRDCEHWLFKELDDSQRRVICNLLPLLLRGELSWKAVKGAYDTGLVYRDKSGMAAVPVSPAASVVMYQVLLSTACQSTTPRLASESNASERSYQFERRVRSCLASCTVLQVNTKNFDGTASPNPLHVRVDHVAFVDKLEETVSPLIGGVLYSPNYQQFPCDAIIVPPIPMADTDCDIDDATYIGGAEESAHISTSSEVTQSAPGANSILQVWECSVTNPRQGSRLAKLMRWFQEGGLIAQLKQLHPTRRITAVICWPEFLVRSAKTSRTCQSFLAAAHEADVSLLVVDQPVLASWGIALSKPAAQYRKQRIHFSNSSIL